MSEQATPIVAPPAESRPPKVRTRPTTSLVEPTILRRAVGEAFIKLNPRTMIRNPVMFTVEIGSVITSVEFFGRPDVFVGLVTLWLWATVLFANFAAVSFITGTNWQAYEGETQASYLPDTVGLVVAQFTAAGVGIAVALAVVRGIAGKSRTIGNFWWDLTRSLVRVLVPLSIIGARANRRVRSGSITRRRCLRRSAGRGTPLHNRPAA